MTIRLEFFGIPRQRAGVKWLSVAADTLGEALQAASRELPRLAECQAANGDVAASCLANINGKQFTRDGRTPLRNGDEVLILSADVGG